jgi:hypothetical protein
MRKEDSIILFNEKEVRRIWDDEREVWYFSVIDIIEVLTESINPKKYWSVLKTRLKKENSQVATDCSHLKLKATD